MDILQIALIFLIMLLGVFLTITGIQVFLILRDLKKSLDKFNRVLSSGERIAKDVEKPAEVVASVAETIESGVRAVENGVRAVEAVTKAVVPASPAKRGEPKPQPQQKPSKPRFYKKILK